MQGCISQTGFSPIVCLQECVSDHPEVAKGMKGGDPGAPAPTPTLPRSQLRVNIKAGVEPS